MITALEIIVVILALLIIGVVVAQKSKTQGMGAGFTIFTLVLGRLLNTY